VVEAELDAASLSPGTMADPQPASVTTPRSIAAPDRTTARTPSRRLSDSHVTWFGAVVDRRRARPGPRLADGVRQLGHLLHPEAVADPGLPLIELQCPPVTTAIGT